MSSMFSGCTSLKKLNPINFKGNNLRDMNNIFNGCTSLIELNFTNFNPNNVITGNIKSGICVNGLAFPMIKQNTIYSNLHQGILVCDDACVSIEENKIYRNLKANIAFGGETGFMTLVVNNDVFSGRCQGIFYIDTYGGLIVRNRIFENNEVLCCLMLKI